METTGLSDWEQRNVHQKLPDPYEATDTGILTPTPHLETHQRALEPHRCDWVCAIKRHCEHFQTVTVRFGNRQKEKCIRVLFNNTEC
jgi:hypothetical protein